MPLYEYVCSNCRKLFSEVLTVKEHETKKIHCPKCQSEQVEKVIEAVTVVTSKKSRSW
jgi:putative FmdB family regulatory protein